MENQDELAEAEARSLLRRSASPGRIGTYTMLGAGGGIVPLPWVPDAIARRLRGAMLHDLTSRQGLSLTPEARAILAEPHGTEGPRGVIAQGLTFAATKMLGRFGPLGFLPPVRSALATFLLGHLFQRYLEVLRSDRAVRIDIEEARRVKAAIDRALVLALTMDARTPQEDRAHPPEDLRDQATQLLDGVLIGLAGVPAWALRRVEASFDEAVSAVRA